MLLSHNELCRLAADGVIKHVEDDAVNSASIDLTLGTHILRELPISKVRRQLTPTRGKRAGQPPVKTVSLRSRTPLDMERVNITNGYVLQPGEFILAHTVQEFNLPPTISGEYKLKSSMARISLEHLNAGWCVVGSTLISMADSPKRPINSLVGQTPTILACDTDYNVVPAQASRVFVSGMVKDTVIVQLSNRQRFECPPTHKVMKLSGGYASVADLEVGMPLMATDRSKVHEVIDIKEQRRRRPIPVYDMTIPIHHNYALGAGVFSHNCDAGWHGSVLTLELKVMALHHAIELRAGDAIGQIVFFAHSAVPADKSYAARGRYCNDTSVQAIKK